MILASSNAIGSLGSALLLPNLSKRSLAIIKPNNPNAFTELDLLAKATATISTGSDIKEIAESSFDGVIVAGQNTAQIMQATKTSSVSELLEQLHRITTPDGFLYISISSSNGSALNPLAAVSRMLAPGKLQGSLEGSAFSLSNLFALFGSSTCPEFAVPTLTKRELNKSLKQMIAIPHQFPFTRTPIRKAVFSLAIHVGAKWWIRSCSSAHSIIAFK